MTINKIIRIAIASILSTIMIYLTLLLSGKIEFSTEKFFHYFWVWGTFLFFSALLISYYSPLIYGDDKKDDVKKARAQKKKQKKGK